MPCVDASRADYMTLTAKHTGLELWEHIFVLSALKAKQYFPQIDIFKNTRSTACSTRSA